MKQLLIVRDFNRKHVARTVYELPEGMCVRISEQTRSPAQNDRMWALLEDVSKQVEWYGQHLTKYDWKDVFSASLKRQKVVPGLDGGFVVCGQSTSKMTKSELSDLMTLIEAFGSERGVKWTQGE